MSAYCGRSGSRTAWSNSATSATLMPTSRTMSARRLTAECYAGPRGLEGWPLRLPDGGGLADLRARRGGRRVAADPEVGRGVAAGAVPALDRRAVARRPAGARGRRSGLVLGRGRRRHRRSPGGGGRREVLDLTGGPAWARWWSGGEFDYARAAIEPRAARDPDGEALVWEGEDGAVRRLTNARARPRPSRPPPDACRRTASGPAIGSGSCCRCSSRRSSRCWRSAGCRRSTRRSSAATARRRSRPASPTARRRCSSPRTASSDAASWVPLKAVADEAVAAAPSVRRVARRAAGGRGDRHAVDGRSRRVVGRGPVPRRGGGASSAARSTPRRRTCSSTPRARPADRRAPSTSTAASRSRPPRTSPTSSTSGRGDTLFWFTDLGWMMGPWAISGSLLLGARLVLYEGAPDFPGAGPAVVARRAPPGHAPRPVADRHPGADGARRGAGPLARPLVAARAGLDRRAVEPRSVVVVLPRGRRGPLPDRQLLGRDGGLGRDRQRQRRRTDQAGVVLRAVHRDGRRRRGRGRRRSAARSASSSSGRRCRA